MSKVAQALIGNSKKQFLILEPVDLKGNNLILMNKLLKN